MVLHTKNLGDKSVMIAGAWEAGEMEKYDSIGENFLLNYTNKFQTSSVQHCACS